MPLSVLPLLGPASEMMSRVCGVLLASTLKVPDRLSLPSSRVYLSPWIVSLLFLNWSAGTSLPSRTTETRTQVPCSLSRSLPASAARARPPTSRPAISHGIRRIDHLLSSGRLFRVGHRLELDDAARLLLLQVLAPLLDVNVVPGQQLAHRPVALRVPGHVDAQVGEGLPPHLRPEALAPAVHATAAPPRLLQGRRHAPVAARQDALQLTQHDVVLLD